MNFTFIINAVLISSEFPYKFERQPRDFVTWSYGLAYVETFDTSMISKMNRLTRKMSDIYYEN